jgi:hypothetical protein
MLQEYQVQGMFTIIPKVLRTGHDDTDRDQICPPCRKSRVLTMVSSLRQTVDLRVETIQDQILNGFMWQQLKLWVKQGLIGCAQVNL